jgi:hypothetical protein
MVQSEDGIDAFIHPRLLYCSMAESHAEVVEEAKNTMDEQIAGVMPDTWHGHARLKIAERGYTGEKKMFAQRLAERVIRRFDADAETAAEKAIQKTEEKF